MRQQCFASAMFALLVVGAHGQTCNAARKATYTSPEGSLVAVVQPSTKPQTCESAVELRTGPGKVLVRRSYQSDGGEHGYGVVKAQWTPDSKYFVFSLESSGGHQPWHSPVEHFLRISRPATILRCAIWSFFSCASTQQTNLGIPVGEGSQFAEDVTGRTSAPRAGDSTS